MSRPSIFSDSSKSANNYTMRDTSVWRRLDGIKNNRERTSVDDIETETRAGNTRRHKPESWGPKISLFSQSATSSISTTSCLKISRLESCQRSFPTNMLLPQTHVSYKPTQHHTITAHQSCPVIEINRFRPLWHPHIY